MSRTTDLAIASSMVAMDAMLGAAELLNGAKAMAARVGFSNSVIKVMKLLGGGSGVAFLARLATAVLFATASYILLLMQSRYQFDHHMLVAVVFILSLVGVARPLAVAILSVLALFALVPEAALLLKALGNGSVG